MIDIDAETDSEICFICKKPITDNDIVWLTLEGEVKGKVSSKERLALCRSCGNKLDKML